MIRSFIVGDTVRDWHVEQVDSAFCPYDDNFDPVELSDNTAWARELWPMRTAIGSVISFAGKTRLECGDRWWTWYRWIADKYRVTLSIVFAEVATHNHFVLDRGGKVFNRTAPVIKLPEDATEDDHLALLGLLNSSTACFWMRQSCHNKGGGASVSKLAPENWENFFGFNGTNIERLPLPKDRPLGISKQLDEYAQSLNTLQPAHILTQRRKGAKEGMASKLCALAPLRETLLAARKHWEQTRAQMIAAQEDLDWECYKLYGLIDKDLTEKNSVSSVPPWLPLSLGQRAFEIILARKIASGETQSTWFARHGSTPITELPAQWPDDYKKLVERRIELIENDPNIRLIEQPEYKRRWNTEPWESQLERALREWLLLRLETFFDFDGRMTDLTQRRKDAKEDKETDLSAFAPLREISLYSVTKLADAARQDPQFLEVGELYRDDPAFDVQALVEELVAAESVPYLPILRYKDTGLRKRAEWEKTWELQREEDRRNEPRSHGENGENQDIKSDEKNRISNSTSVSSVSPWLKIPVPPKYVSADMISTGGARYWRLRGKLDVPKERWISFPHCEGPDGTLAICWAGYDHLQQAQAISAYYVRVQTEFGGSDDPRLIPLLASLIELLPWLKQWHNAPNPNFDGLRMGDYFDGFVNEEARNLGKTLAEIKAWVPPKKLAKAPKAKKTKKNASQSSADREE